LGPNNWYSKNKDKDARLKSEAAATKAKTKTKSRLPRSLGCARDKFRPRRYESNGNTERQDPPGVRHGGRQMGHPEKLKAKT
jgi:hypothetical protein